MKSKSVKKVSDEGRIRKRKSKSRKTKRHYSSSSDSSLTLKKKKKLKKTKVSKKRNPRKKVRHVSTSPSSSRDYSSDSCEKQNPKKKGKFRKNGLIRERKYKDRERGRSPKRSRSSTCSSISRSPSRRKRSFRKEKREKVERETISNDNVLDAYDDFPSSSSKYNEIREKEENARISRRDSSREREESEPSFERREKDETKKPQNEGKKKEEVVDAELVLRQKALENFIKFQKIKIYSNNTNGDERENLGSNEQSKEIERVELNSYERYEPVLSEPITEEEIYEDLNEKEEIISDLSVKKPRLRSVISIPIETENNEANTIIESFDKNEGSNLNFEESFDLTESNPNPNPNSDSNPNPSTSEGEFQEKTFSRMRDGEMVQVSYKVYIPKRAPALARRKLIR